MNHFEVIAHSSHFLLHGVHFVLVSEVFKFGIILVKTHIVLRTQRHCGEFGREVLSIASIFELGHIRWRQLHLFHCIPSNIAKPWV
jgi:hypothetical protein